MKKITFINSFRESCGVFQYGKRLSNILKKSTNYHLNYIEIETEENFFTNLNGLPNDTDFFIFNYHPLTMPWLGNHILQQLPNSKKIMLFHEGSEPAINVDSYILVSETENDLGNKYSIPRPLFENLNLKPIEAIKTFPIISSYGFGFGDKGFGRVVKIINEQFDNALIRLHIPFAYYGDREGQSIKNIYPGCYNEITKPGIKLEITNNFLTEQELLQFLSESTLNIFLYDEMKGRGLSSVIDYALSVDVPLAINKSWMFRKIYNTSPSICVEDKSLKEIIDQGIQPLQQYRDKWSNENLIKKVEQILNQTI